MLPCLQSSGRQGAISASERTAYIGRVRKLARMCAKAYLAQREKLGYPMMGKNRKAQVK